MRSDRQGKKASSGAATGLTLAELVAMQTRHIHTPLAPGERFPTGMRPGRRQAQGMDVDSTSPYVPGDDVRSIDWRATARTGRTQMKRYVAESHLGRMLVVDLRSHMFFGTRRRPMAKTAAMVAARLAWEALALQEPLGLLVVSPTDTPETLDLMVPRRGDAHLLQTLNALQKAYAKALEEAKNPESSNPDDQVLYQALDTAAANLGRADEICLISDFGDAGHDFIQASKRLSPIRALHAFVVEDDIYSNPAPKGNYPLRQFLGAERIVAQLTGNAERHHQAAADMRKNLQRTLIGAGWHVSGGPHLILEPEGEAQ